MIIKPKIEILTSPICLDPIPKNPILLDVNINSMFISDKVLSGQKIINTLLVTKMMIIRLTIMCNKCIKSVFVKNSDGETKWMIF